MYERVVAKNLHPCSYTFLTTSIKLPFDAFSGVFQRSSTMLLASHIRISKKIMAHQVKPLIFSIHEGFCGGKHSKEPSSPHITILLIQNPIAFC